MIFYFWPGESSCDHKALKRYIKKGKIKNGISQSAWQQPETPGGKGWKRKKDINCFSYGHLRQKNNNRTSEKYIS